MSLGLLALSTGAYWLVPSGVVPFGLDAAVILAATAGATALGAAGIGARTPAATTGETALGVALDAPAAGGVLGPGDTAVTVGSALAILGGSGFVGRLVRLIGTRVYSASPA